jgi:hypothetical protein
MRKYFFFSHPRYKRHNIIFLLTIVLQTLKHTPTETHRDTDTQKHVRRSISIRRGAQCLWCV